MAQSQEPTTSPLEPLPYAHSFMLLPPRTVTINRALHPPIILRVLVPTEMDGHAISAQPYAMDGDDKLRYVLNGSVVHQGQFVADYIPEAGGSSSSSGGYGSGYVPLYFVFPHLSFTSTGSYKIRISLQDINELYSPNGPYIGDVETDFFDIIRRNAKRQVPNRREAALMDYLRGAGFDSMPAST